MLVISTVRGEIVRDKGVLGRGDIREFNQFIFDVELEVIHATGRSFTWFRSNGSAKSKLDKFLVSSKCLNV
uniref:Uncharacterized protein n=1 Tax=Cajanus cajan TaxID=3821 RepID=A0A151R572_CAJCA|nr:hypothetical protein KK1_041044 [Cajanus cajan]